MKSKLKHKKTRKLSMGTITGTLGLFTSSKFLLLTRHQAITSIFKDKIRGIKDQNKLKMQSQTLGKMESF